MRRGLIIAAVMILMCSATVHASEVPEDIKAAAEEYGEEYGICPELIMAICFEESRFTPGIINRSGKNYGLMQINPNFNTARMERLGVTKSDLLTVTGNILVGADLLSELFQESEDVVDVLLQYGGFSKAKIEAYHNEGKIPAYITRLLDRSRSYEEQREAANEAL